MPKEKFLATHLPSGEYVKISYFETVIGNPFKTVPVLFLHGLTSSKRPLWNTVVQSYITEAQKHNFSARVIAFDWPGHGHSSRGLSYSLGSLENVTTTVMDALQIEAAHIFGMSLGGMASILVAARHPERVLSIAPQGAPVNRRDWGALGAFGRRIFKATRPLRPLVPENNRFVAKPAMLLLAKYLQNKSLPILYENDLRRLMADKLMVKTVVEDIRNLSPRALFAYAHDVVRADLRAHLTDIAEAQTPMLAIDGAAPEHPGLDTLGDISALVPHAETLRVPNSGHAATIVYPEQVAKRLAHFHIKHSS